MLLGRAAVRWGGWGRGRNRCLGGWAHLCSFTELTNMLPWCNSVEFFPLTEDFWSRSLSRISRGNANLLVLSYCPAQCMNPVYKKEIISNSGFLILLKWIQLLSLHFPIRAAHQPALFVQKPARMFQPLWGINAGSQHWVGSPCSSCYRVSQSGILVNIYV